MKATRLVLAALAMAAFSAWCPADTIDPLLGTGGSGTPGFDITSLSFTFVSPTGGLGDCTVNGTNVPGCIFRNDTGFQINQVDVTISGNSISPVGCVISRGEPFGDCTISQNGTFATFFGGEGISAGPPHRNFQFGVFGFSPNTSFAVQLIPAVPEPGTLVLLLSGLGAAFARLRKGSA